MANASYVIDTNLPFISVPHRFSTRSWLLRFNVGTSYPVIKDEDVLNMPIPILGDDIKQDVVAKVNESASLRRQSKQLLEYAKQAVEMAIEQGEDIALAWLKSKVEQ